MQLNALESSFNSLIHVLYNLLYYSTNYYVTTPTVWFEEEWFIIRIFILCCTFNFLQILTLIL